MHIKVAITHVSNRRAAGSRNNENQIVLSCYSYFGFELAARRN